MMAQFTNGNKMKILFPCEPEYINRPDSSFEDEFNAAKSVGFETLFYDYDELIAGNLQRSVRRIEKVDELEDSTILLRGWMVNGEVYSSLENALRKKGFVLVTTAHQYEKAHYLPNWYPNVAEYTADSRWVDGDNLENAWNMYEEHFSTKDSIIKDFVKSAKYRWKDGCFIPSNTSYEKFSEIFKVFREERGNLFNRGVVIREFISFEEKGGKISDLPIIEEKRIFFWHGKILAASNGSPVESPTWEILAQTFDCPFITIDVAKTVSGDWKVMECGDGGVSGLPDDIDPLIFYSILSNKKTEPA